MEQESKGSDIEVTPAPERYAEPEIENTDDDTPTQWVPTRFEKRVHAIPERFWTLYQVICGALIGAFTVFALFQGGSDFSPLFWVALALALVFPNIMEARGRRSLMRLRIALIVTLIVGMAAVLLYKGTTQGWGFLTQQETATFAAALPRL